jgi:hypothetical protein
MSRAPLNFLDDANVSRPAPGATFLRSGARDQSQPWRCVLVHFCGWRIIKLHVNTSTCFVTILAGCRAATLKHFDSSNKNIYLVFWLHGFEQL